MNPYKAKRPVSAGAIFYIVLFFLVLAGLGYLLYYDKGLFWDMLPLVCIPALLLAIGIIIFYFAKRATIGYTFILFLLIFITGLILSAFYGPFAIVRQAREFYDSKDYKASIDKYQVIYEEYPRSRYYDEAITQLAYSSYLDEDYEMALENLDKAVEKELLSAQDIEVLKIYTDCYSELGDSAFASGDFDLAAQYYIEASDYYDIILKNYPDTNEAFIADYKAPEYRVKAAESNFNLGHYGLSISILEETLAEYPDTDFREEAADLLFRSRIEIAKSELSEKDYKEALDNLLGILDLDEEFIDLDDYRFVRIKNLVFSDTPIYLLRDIGYGLYNSEDFKKALFIFEGLSQYNPEISDQFLSYIVSSKVNLTADGDFRQLQVSDPVGSISLNDKSIISFENETEHTLKIYMRGSEYKIFDIASESKKEVEVLSGYYQVLVEILNTDISPFYGKFSYDSGAKYREVFNLED